ncbi:hypothetical protein VPNG_02261 [Cytospora leucostoma]|uniref:FAD-binding PCMH-type domain-containing protein n=1 Tax=Cytospora leucostoma TaxID=1230097 RepID=A0A423XGF0_9PEZI|nr:hypothetical protein VPNG_02261 [Cytospora leucostoma]
MSLNLFFALLAACSAIAGTSSSLAQNGTAACGNLASTFPAKTFVEGTSTYELESNSSIWSKTCVLSPACVFTPSDELDIAAALRIIQEAQSPFSVRSGGHMPVPGAQSNDGGVEIALTNLNNLSLSSDQSIASIGPGNRWVDVYNWTSGYGLGVSGGRYGEVGVGGLLTGGGINFFASQYGWSFNTVVGYQVVLGNSSIVEVSNTSHPDLFWALKGGNNNFGIVTRFDLKTFPITTAYSGTTVWPEDQLSAVIDAIQNFVLPGGGIDDPLTEINPTIEVLPSTGAIEPYYIPFVRGSDANPASVENFTSITGAISNDVAVQADWTAVAFEAVSEDSNSLREQFLAFSLKAAPGVVQLAYDTILEPALQQLQSINNSYVAVAYQPISQLWLQAARDAGGDAIDLDPDDGSLVALVITAGWSDAADDETIYAFTSSALANLTTKAKEQDVFYDFVYLNDAAAGQSPYETYGKGKSLPRLKEIQARYDPLSVFKDLATSGFKL